MIRLLDKGSTTNLKGFKKDTKTTEGVLRFDDDHNIFLEPKIKEIQKAKEFSCPKCSKGKIIKGKTAYGCSNYKKGCDFVFPFEKIKVMAAGKKLSKELVLEILNSSVSP